MEWCRQLFCSKNFILSALVYEPTSMVRAGVQSINITWHNFALHVADWGHHALLTAFYNWVLKLSLICLCNFLSSLNFLIKLPVWQNVLIWTSELAHHHHHHSPIPHPPSHSSHHYHLHPHRHLRQVWIVRSWFHFHTKNNKKLIQQGIKKVSFTDCDSRKL